MWKLIKFLFFAWLTIFFIIPLLIGLAISQSHSAPLLTKLEQSYITDANHALYVFTLNANCNYVSQTTLTAVTDGVISTAKVAVGEQRMDQFDATEGRQVLIKLAQIANYMKGLHGNELKAVCKSHRAEFNRIYRYLVSLSDESGESADN
jgi:hypothetical protein